MNIEIILITYNRKEHLQNTFNQIFADDSPIKNFDITILDNKSTDGTSELIEKYKQTFPNIKHIVHNRNIGGNANITRAFEIATKKYVWILCDDDEYDWTHWNEVENAIASDKYDLIYTINSLSAACNKNKIEQLLFLAAFLPGVIYKTECISNDIVQNMYGSIHTWYPQSILSIDILINKNLPFYVPKNNIIKRGIIENSIENIKSLTRGIDEKNIHPDLERIFWHIGFIKAAQIIKDKKMKNQILKKVNFNEQSDQSFWDYISTIFIYNYINKNDNINNIVDLCLCFNGFTRIQLTIYSVLYYTLFKIIYIYRDNNGYMIRIFNKLKTRLIKIK